MINNRTEALKTDVHLFFYNNNMPKWSSVDFKRGETRGKKIKLKLYWIYFSRNDSENYRLRELQTATYNNFLNRFSETNLYSIRKFLQTRSNIPKLSPVFLVVLKLHAAK